MRECWSALRKSYVVDDTRYPTWAEVLDACGDAGWELVAVTDAPHAQTAGKLAETTFYFKRPTAFTETIPAD